MQSGISATQALQQPGAKTLNKQPRPGVMASMQLDASAIHKRFSSQDVIVPYRCNSQLGAYYAAGRKCLTSTFSQC